MLLTRLARLGRTDERGSVLVAVIGVMMVGLVLTALIASSIVNGFGHTTAARAGVQSHASADAGIAAARTALFTPNNCLMQPTPGTYTSTVPPIFTVRVEYNAGAGWQVGCPTLAATQIRLVSVGTALAPGVAGVSSGDKSKVEAVFSYLTPGPPPSGIGMYLFAGGEFEANSTLDLSEVGNTGIITKMGDLDCSKNNTVFNASVVVHGDLNFHDNDCSVTGNAWVSGTAILGSKGHIGGALIAPNVSPNPPGGQVGSWATTGDAPVAPDWVNLTYDPGAWKYGIAPLDTPFEVRDASATMACKLTNGSLGGTAPGTPVIINALGCSGGLTTTNNTTVKLTGDVVIFADIFNFDAINSLVFTSSSTAAHRLWFITPDTGVADDNLPTCAPGQGNFTVNNSFEIQKPIAALVYTPCAFDGKNGFTWNGQVYAGQTSFIKNNPKFTFSKVGAAGVNFDTGDEHLPDITKPQPGGVVSMRDVN
jgi:hypothetical protein